MVFRNMGMGVAVVGRSVVGLGAGHQRNVPLPVAAQKGQSNGNEKRCEYYDP